MSRPTTITTFVPFSTWSPDLGVYDNPGLMAAKNLFPFGDGGFSSVLALDSGYALTAVAMGMGTHPDTTNVFYGATDDLREVVVGVSDTRRRGAVYTAEGLPVGWSFCAFGPDLIAVGGITQRPQYRDADTAGNFADLLDATTLARTDLMPRYVCAVGQHIMFGNINDAFPAPDVHYPDRVWLSAINNARRFGTQLTDPALLTTYQDLYDDYGHITGLSGGNDYAFIFKHRCIYRMDFAGPFGLTFKPISLGTGTIAPHSIIEVDGDVYFWGTNGPAVIRQGGTVVNLVNTSLARILMSKDTSYPQASDSALFYANEPGNCRAWYCPFTRCVCWTFDGKLYATSTRLVATVCYQPETGRWGYTHEQTNSGASAVRGAASQFLTAAKTWEFGRLQYLALGGTTSKIHQYTATTPEVYVGTARVICRELLGDKYTTAKIVRIRPRLRHSYSALTISLSIQSYSDTYSDTVVQATAASLANNADQSGFISCETDVAQSFDIGLTIGGAVDTTDRLYELAGMDVEFDVSGTKGP